jgi:uncharacterized protein
MTPDSLSTYTKKKLTNLARSRGVSGAHSLRKEELIAAILTKKKPDADPKPKTGGSAATKSGAGVRSRSATATSRPAGSSSASRGDSRVSASRSSRVSQRPAAKVAGPPARRLKAVSERGPDVMDLRPLDRNWVQIRWQLSGETLRRARTALDWEFHSARPILRLFDITEQDERQSAAARVTDIELDGEVTGWCLRIPDPARKYSVHLGLLAEAGRFHILVRSRPLVMPDHGSVAVLLQPEEASSRNLSSAVDYDASDEPRAWSAADLTPMQLKNLAASRSSQSGPETSSAFHLAVGAELLVHGTTHPEAELTLLGKRASVATDGRFNLRMKLAPGRHVIPAVATTPDGAEERTYVLAVELTSRELEPRYIEEVPR